MGILRIFFFFSSPVFFLTYDGNHIQCDNGVIQCTLTFFRYKLKCTLFAIAQCRIGVIPSNSSFSGFLSEAIRSDLLQNWLFKVIRCEIRWICPIEEVNI